MRLSVLRKDRHAEFWAMINQACDHRAADIAALKREPFARVLDQIIHWLHSAIASQEAAKKLKRR